MTILVGYVPTPAGGAALAWAIGEALFRRSRLVVLNVVVGTDCSVPTFADEKDLDAAASAVRAAEVDVEIIQLTNTRSVSEEILEVAEKVDASMIVLATNPESFTTRHLVGGTVHDVLTHAKCPVLVTRPERW